MIKARLTESLMPDSLEVLDESYRHVGHVGARSGKGHFAITIVSSKFSNMSALQRHRMIYDVLEEAMQTDIHALSINAYGPDEI